MEFSTKTLNGKTTDQLSKYESITIDPDWLDQQSVETTVPNVSPCKSSEELVEISGTIHQTIGNTIVHNERNKRSKASEMQSLKNSPLS